MLYFAYGSNMSEKRLAARVGEIRKVGVAKLSNYILRFNKVGRDLSGKCNICKAPKAFVLGVVYQIDDSQKIILDEYEGVGFGYKNKHIKVIDINKKEELNVITYVATYINDKLLPYSWYKVHVLRGAIENKFQREYISNIVNVKAVKDPNIHRAKRELAIYSKKITNM